MMPSTRFFVQAAAMAVLGAGLPASVPAAGGDAASRLSAALGGPLGDGMQDAGGMGHGKVDSTVELRPARTDVYRRQVAALLMANGRPQKTVPGL
jgi:hypothetical protein